MKTKSAKSNYGVLVLSRQSMRALQAEWQPVEPPPPPMRLTSETDNVLAFSATPRAHNRDAA